MCAFACYVLRFLSVFMGYVHVLSLCMYDFMSAIMVLAASNETDDDATFFDASCIMR